MSRAQAAGGLVFACLMVVLGVVLLDVKLVLIAVGLIVLFALLIGLTKLADRGFDGVQRKLDERAEREQRTA